MDADTLIDCLEQEGVLLAAAASAAGWAAPVPGLDWDVRALVAHTGGVHRWATSIVRAEPREDVRAASSAVGHAPPDDELADWFGAGHAALVDTLRAAPPDLKAFTFLPDDSPRRFWARRQAHETAIHRADAQRAAGEQPTFERGFAMDGIAEALALGAHESFAIDQEARVLLEVTDGTSWLLTFGGSKNVAEPVADCPATDATVRGSASEVYLWLWNRRSDAEANGEAADLWSQRVRITRG